MRRKTETPIAVRRACRIVCVLLAFATVLLFFAGECRLAQIFECLSAEDETVRQYYLESLRLLSRHNLVSNLCHGKYSQSGSASVCLLIRRPDGALMRNAYPLINQFGYTGAFLLTGDTLPGTPGNLSVAEYSSLTSSGWRAVLGGTGGVDISRPDSADAFRAYISDVTKSLTQRGFDPPQVYYLEQHDASEDCLRVLGEQGVRVVIQGYAAEKQSERYTGKWWSGMYFCGSVTLQNDTSNVQESVYYAGLGGGSMVVTTRRVTDEGADNALDCSPDKLRTCLEWFRDDHNTYGFHITGLGGLYSEKYRAYERLLIATAGYDTPEAYLDELDVQLFEISRETAELIGQLYEPANKPYTPGEFFSFVTSHSPREIFALITGYRRLNRDYAEIRQGLNGITTGTGENQISHQQKQ